MGGSLARAAAAAVGALSLASPHVASAATHALDLPKDAATVFTTRAPDYALGSAVAPAGDVNGDGNPDLVIGASDSSHNGRRGSGSAYVVFGSPAFAPRMPLDPLGERGFRIDGAPPEVRVRQRDVFGDGTGLLTAAAGSDVAGLGDVNGDGLADVAVAAPDASPHRRVAAGAVYVVFGKRTSGPVDLKKLGSRGYRIAGVRKGQETGDPVAAAGDINGDGRGDLLIGGFPGLSGKLPGRVYVVFGRAEPGGVDLAHLGSGGVVIRGPWTTGPSLGALGDVDADGLPDIVVGVSPTTKDGDGHAYVIFGRAAPGQLRLGRLGSAGYSIRDSRATNPVRGVPDFGGNLGGIVGGPGDVNGDGRPDVLIGGGDVTLVLFSDGTRRSVDLGRAGDRTIDISGADISDETWGTGDANGDGRDDVLVAEPFGEPRCRASAGMTSVVYGRATRGTVDLRNLGGAGYRIDGIHGIDSVAWAGDLNGDGRSDVLLGSPGAGAHGRAYIVSGRSGDVPTVRGGPCLQIQIPRQTLSRVERTRRLRVVVSARSPGTYYLTAHVKHHRALAKGQVHFKRAGSKHSVLRLTSSGRHVVQGRARLRVKVTAERGPFVNPRAAATAVLVR